MYDILTSHAASARRYERQEVSSLPQSVPVCRWYDVMSYTHFLKCMNSWNVFHKQGHSPLAETVTVPALSQEMDNYLTLGMLSLIDDTYTSHIRSKESHFCLPF